MHRRDLDIKGFLGRTAAVAAILLFFHWIPDLYVWFSANAQHRAVVIDPRRYRFILIVAYALCGFGFLLESSGILRELIRRRRHRIRSDPE
ncbi:hypothetical protein A4W93_11915 [Piscinibacter gummiphilus]|uniref:Uncharacterized protein n=2 Tax=Piscinibacter gummiphilus TaxID=946333 RepID=A0A1W6L8J9_9BURK|nr:hypothetical protein A4W93_11915 [Piscinibacter gummiphilus]ATU65218.1 hypothetical protein CPZ87_11990 [Piscinibacter gummiphilus]